MHFDERREGDFRIYTGALEAPQDSGYIAAVVVERIGAEGSVRIVFRDDCMSGGHRWPTPHAALQFALAIGRQFVRKQEPARAPGAAEARWAQWSCRETA